jgi:hypothetical protein
VQYERASRGLRMAARADQSAGTEAWQVVRTDLVREA